MLVLLGGAMSSEVMNDWSNEELGCSFRGWMCVLLTLLLPVLLLLLEHLFTQTIRIVSYKC